jgi:predicted aspartyl protease
MIIGSVSATKEAVVRLRVRGPAGPGAEVDAVLDTGFTEYLTLPQAIITSLSLP